MKLDRRHPGAPDRTRSTDPPGMGGSQIMAMVATCHMKSIEGTDWRACEEIAAWIKGLYPQLFEDRRYWYALPQERAS